MAVKTGNYFVGTAFGNLLLRCWGYGPCINNEGIASMLYITVTRTEGKVTAASVHETPNPVCETRNNWKTFDDAKEVAAALGEGFIATDAGSNVSPRYDVQCLPKVGDDVSYAFNGDSYPCGKIVSISKSLKVIVTKDEAKGEGVKKFYRVRETGTWRNAGTWSLISGHHYTQNPSF